jgi:hypothetical protein
MALKIDSRLIQRLPEQRSHKPSTPAVLQLAADPVRPRCLITVVTCPISYRLDFGHPANLNLTITPAGIFLDPDSIIIAQLSSLRSILLRRANSLLISIFQEGERLFGSKARGAFEVIGA